MSRELDGIEMMMEALTTNDAALAHRAMAYFNPKEDVVDFTMQVGEKTVHISVYLEDDNWGLIDVLYQGQERPWPVFINEDPSLKWTEPTDKLNVTMAYEVLVHMSQL